jgi:hypothetical protein
MRVPQEQRGYAVNPEDLQLVDLMCRLKLNVQHRLEWI